MCKHIKDKKKITFFPTTPFALKKSKEYARREQSKENLESLGNLGSLGSLEKATSDKQ